MPFASFFFSARSAVVIGTDQNCLLMSFIYLISTVFDFLFGLDFGAVFVLQTAGGQMENTGHGKINKINPCELGWNKGMVIYVPWTTQNFTCTTWQLFINFLPVLNFLFFLLVIHKGNNVNWCFIMWVTSAHLNRPSALRITLVLGMDKKRSSLSPFSYPLHRSSCRPSINMSIISPVIIKKVKSFSIKSSCVCGMGQHFVFRKTTILNGNFFVPEHPRKFSSNLHWNKIRKTKTLSIQWIVERWHGMGTSEREGIQ